MIDENHKLSNVVVTLKNPSKLNASKSTPMPAKVLSLLSPSQI